MIWALAAFFGNIIEQLMITSVIREMNPIIYVALFYLFSTVFLVLFHAVSKKHEQFFDWQKARQHKLWAMGFAGGAFIGNALWFLSVYLMGLGITGFLLVFIRVLVTVYAYVYMKDRFPLDKAIAFSLGVVMLLCFSLSDGGGNILGITAALLSCFGFAMEAISRKKLVEYDVRAENMMLFRSVVLLVLSWSAVAVAVLFNIVEARDIVTMEIQSFLLIIGAALLGGLGVNMFVFYAMKERVGSILQKYNGTFSAPHTADEKIVNEDRVINVTVPRENKDSFNKNIKSLGGSKIFYKDHPYYSAATARWPKGISVQERKPL